MEGLAGVIVALGTLAAALSAMVIAFINSRSASDAKVKAALAVAAAEAAKIAAEESKKAIVVTQEGVFEIGKRIDGRLSELLALTTKAALAEGRLAGQSDVRGRAPELSAPAAPPLSGAPLVIEGEVTLTPPSGEGDKEKTSG